MNKANNRTRKRLNGSYLISMVSIILVLVLVGAFVASMIFAKNLSNSIRENINFEIVFRKNATQESIDRLKSNLESREYVKSVVFVSQEEATERLNDALGEDFTRWLGDVDNPLLPSLEVRFVADYANNDSLLLIEQWAKDRAGVGEVHYQRELVRSINKNINNISTLMGVLCGIFLIISVILLSHTIRLSMYARRFSIRTMMLVGATRPFIRRPFLISFLKQGFWSALIAIVILIIGLITLFNRIPDIEQFFSFFNIFLLIVGLIVISTLITTLSTFFTVNHYLDADLDELYS